MSSTRKECEKAIETLKNKYVNYDVVDELVTLKRLIDEHFDNPPLKKEEIKNGMLVWDNFLKHWCIINLIDENDTMHTAISKYYVPYEEGKYFRKKVE